MNIEYSGKKENLDLALETHVQLDDKRKRTGIIKAINRTNMGPIYTIAIDGEKGKTVRAARIHIKNVLEG